MLNKLTFANRIAAKAGVPQRVAYNMLTAFIDVLMEDLPKEKVVQIKNFGTFRLKLRKGRKGKAYFGGQFETQDKQYVKFDISDRLKYLKGRSKVCNLKHLKKKSEK